MSRITNTLGILILVAACSAWSLSKVSEPQPEPAGTPEERIDRALDEMEMMLEEVERMSREKPPGAI